MNIDNKYAEYVSYFEQTLRGSLNGLDKNAPSVIKEAMKYAVSDGGKRVRPVLCYAASEMLGLNKEAVKELALAVEFIHSYSLVHDDLPAMDNDDYRRGKFSTHKKFGEAFGILAGDALLNYAYEICLRSDNFDAAHARALYAIAECAGYSGMIAGQVLDLDCEKLETADEKTLYSIYENKTSKLLTAPLLAASELCGGAYRDELEEYGINLGITFQITDDFMDADGDFAHIGKTPKKDEKENKLTSIKVFGRDGARGLAKTHYELAKKAINAVPNSEFLSAFLDKLYNRTF